MRSHKKIMKKFTMLLVWKKKYTDDLEQVAVEEHSEVDDDITQEETKIQQCNL